MTFTLEDGETLKNKLGATSSEQLNSFEHPLVAIRVMEWRTDISPHMELGATYLQSLHKHLFQDVYEWAGTLRHKTFTFEDGSQAAMPAMHKSGGKDFAIGNQINAGLEKFFDHLNNQNFLTGLDKNTFALEAANAFAHLNSIHPFREGNGRTQREFFTELAKRAGHPINFNVISAERMTDLSIAAHERGDSEPLKRMFVEIATPHRVEALRTAQQAIERFRPVQTPHVSAWMNLYMATTEPGQEYAGRFSGRSGDNFMMQRHDGAIIIGNTVDLPQQPMNAGDMITFTATDPYAPQYFLPARHEWPSSIQEQAAKQLPLSPIMLAASERLETSLAHVWQNPSHVLQTVTSRIDAGENTGKICLEMRNNPENFGELRGARNFLGRQDDARQEALNALPVAISNVSNFGSVRETLKNDLVDAETQFRKFMATPISELSRDAQLFLENISQATVSDKTLLIEQGRSSGLTAELKQVAQAVNERMRFGNPFESAEQEKGNLSQNPQIRFLQIQSVLTICNQLDQAEGRSQSQENAQVHMHF